MEQKRIYHEVRAKQPVKKWPQHFDHIDPCSQALGVILQKVNTSAKIQGTNTGSFRQVKHDAVFATCVVSVCYL